MVYHLFKFPDVGKIQMSMKVGRQSIWVYIHLQIIIDWTSPVPYKLQQEKRGYEECYKGDPKVESESASTFQKHGSFIGSAYEEPSFESGSRNEETLREEGIQFQHSPQQVFISTAVKGDQQNRDIPDKFTNVANGPWEVPKFWQADLSFYTERMLFSLVE